MSIRARGTVADREAAAVLALADVVAEADRVGPLSEQVRLHLRYGGDPAASNLLLWRGSELAGFAHLDPPVAAEGRSGELMVHPAHRRQGLGRELAAAAVAEAGGDPVRIWAHGDLPAAAGLAEATGFSRARALWLMLRPFGAGEPAPPPPPPPGVTLRTFVPGQDEAEWLALNARAFAGHPEQGRWAAGDLARREREPWFDPGGFLLAERDGRLAGFHWTKVHGPAEGGQATAAPVGEVYVLGVDPSEQGTGLGRFLTLAGLSYLRSRGVPAVMLYADATNVPAVKLYQKLRFTHISTDVMYEHRPAGADEQPARLRPPRGRRAPRPALRG